MNKHDNTHIMVGISQNQIATHINQRV